MTREEIKDHITRFSPASTFEETGEWLNVIVEAKDWKQLAGMLKNNETNMEYLFCLTCVDWKTHLTMVYHMTSTGHRQPIVVKCNLDRENPQIDTVSDLWRTAEFHEREVFEMFGVSFKGHPDLRRLILTDDFNGFPLRKDFEDPVNMIRL